MPPPPTVIRARLDRALSTRDLAGVRSAARDMPSVVTLSVAVQVLVLMLEVDDPAFDAAAVRWIGRFVNDRKGVELTEVLAAVEALEALPDPDAQRTLAGLLKRHGHD
jgi:hypothetical protein